MRILTGPTIYRKERRFTEKNRKEPKRTKKNRKGPKRTEKSIHINYYLIYIHQFPPS